MDLKVSEISERLAAKAHAVCAYLLPGGKLHGKEWLCGDITGGPGDSLKVCTEGTYAGQWKDWAHDTDYGDLLDLWEKTRDLTRANAIKQAKDWLGIVEPVRPERAKTYATPPSVLSKPLDPNGQALAYLTQKRCLKASVIKALKIEGSAEKKAIIFPSYNPEGHLVNRSYRTLGADKKVWQDKDCAPSLFGWQALPEEAYKERRVLLSEGQIDCASWLHWGIPALSIPNGTGAAWIEYEWDNLAPFDTIYLAFDEDDAGRKITENAIARLGKHRCMVVALPKKDANECLMAGYSAEDAKKWVEAAKAPRIKRLLTAAELQKRVGLACQPAPEAFTLPFFKRHGQDEGFYFRPGEVTLWGGFAFAGKSTLMNYMLCHLMAFRKRSFVASFEEKAERKIKKLAQICCDTEFTPEYAEGFAAQAGEHLIFADVVGSMAEAELLEMMWYSFRRYGASHFLIDSLMRVEKLEEDYPAQGQFLNNLQNFAKETNGHVHLVTHLAKPSKGQIPSMYSIKGSSLLMGNADNVLLVIRNPEKDQLRKSNQLTVEKDKMMHDTEVIFEKQRESGWTGSVKLKFHPRNYSFSTLHNTPAL